RPPDPCSPSGAGIIIGRGETSKEWQAPQIGLALTGPSTAPVEQEIPYTITVTNVGQVETQALTVRDPLPEGVQFLPSEPRATVEGKQLVWTLGVLPGGRTHLIQVVLQSSRPGPLNHCASVTTVEGYRDEKCITTQITALQQAQLQVTMNEPAAVAV